MNDHYRVSYWGEDPHNPLESALHKRDVVMPSTTKMMLATGKNVPFLYFLIKEGQEWFVPSDHVVEIVEIWKGGNADES